MSRNFVETRYHQRWVLVLALFCVTSVVEAIGLSQVFAFMPLSLQQLGLPPAVVPQWTGVLSALVFVLGLPLVPFWGVWADKYSRKVVIIRSCVVQAMVFGLIALSREPWQLGASFVLAGFQLGNSGVMLATLRDLAPPGRVGLAIGVFGATWPVGSAVGPALGGFVVDGLGAPLWTIFAFSSLISVATALMLALGFREVRPSVIPSGRTVDLAFGAVRGVFTDPVVRLLFGLFGVSFLARQVCNPFLPLLVQQAHGEGTGLASAIALVVGIGALAGGVVSPLAGALGDRFGFRQMLVISMAGSGAAMLLMSQVPGVPILSVANGVLSSMGASVGIMIFGLLAMEVAPERRSAVLNLVYLPLYLAGIVGPAIGAAVATAGLEFVFVLGGAVYMLGTLFAALTRRASQP